MLKMAQIYKFSGFYTVNILTFTQKTTTSSVGNCAFVQISGKFDYPIKYTDPDERSGEDDFRLINYPQAQENIKKPMARSSRGLKKNDSGLCYYNSLVGAAEEKAGINLTRTQKNELFDTLSKGDNPAVESGSGLVNNSNRVISAALSKLGLSDKLSATVYNEKPEEISSYKIEDILIIRQFENHFNLGNSNWRFIWEPPKYNNPANIKRGDTPHLQYIIFKEK
jgi:hypothetical protein